MGTIFLLLAFFFPRLTLVGAWLLGDIPPNATPFVADVLATIVAPRLLVAFWLYDGGYHPLLVLIFGVGGLAELLGGGSKASRSRRDDDD